MKATVNGGHGYGYPLVMSDRNRQDLKVPPNVHRRPETLVSQTAGYQVHDSRWHELADEVDTVDESPLLGDR